MISCSFNLKRDLIFFADFSDFNDADNERHDADGYIADCHHNAYAFISQISEML